MSSTTTDHDHVIHLAIELSCSTWLVAARMPGADRSSLHRIDGGDATARLGIVTSRRSMIFPVVQGGGGTSVLDRRPLGRYKVLQVIVTSSAKSEMASTIEEIFAPRKLDIKRMVISRLFVAT